MRRLLATTLAVGALIGGALVSAAPAGAATYTGPLFMTGGDIATTTATGAVTRLVSSTATTHVSQPAYAPDHRSFVYASNTDGASTGRLYRYDLATKASRLLVTSAALGHVGGYTGDAPIAWYPDGTKIAFVSSDSASGTARLYTMKSDGTALAAVATVSPSVAEKILSLAVTGNGRYIAYGLFEGGQSYLGKVWAVAPGSAPVAVSAVPECGEVVARPGTAQGISYSCSTYDSATRATTTTVFSHDIGTAPKVFLTRSGSAATGGTDKAFQDIIWSHDGSRLLIQMRQSTHQSGDCAVTNTPRVFTVAASNQAITNDYTGPVNHVACEGDITPLKSIAWSPDDSRVAFVDLSYTTTGGDLSTAPASGGARTLVARGTAKLTW